MVKLVRNVDGTAMPQYPRKILNFLGEELMKKLKMCLNPVEKKNGEPASSGNSRIWEEEPIGWGRGYKIDAPILGFITSPYSTVLGSAVSLNTRAST